MLKYSVDDTEFCVNIVKNESNAENLTTVCRYMYFGSGQSTIFGFY